MMNDKNIQHFVEEINSHIGPVIEIRQIQDPEYPHFELQLARTKYVMRDQVVIERDGEFFQLVEKIAAKYFPSRASYNNTGRIFWFL